MTETHKGRCFCGAVEIEATGTPIEMGYCHCTSCRAYGGGPFKSYILWKANDIRVIRGADLLGHFNKTGMSDRQHCRACGGHVLNGHPGLGLVDVAASIFPTVAFVPTVHLNYGEAVQRVTDGLPKLKDFPKEAGGSGELLAE